MVHLHLNPPNENSVDSRRSGNIGGLVRSEVGVSLTELEGEFERAGPDMVRNRGVGFRKKPPASFLPALPPPITWGGAARLGFI